MPQGKAHCRGRIRVGGRFNQHEDEVMPLAGRKTCRNENPGDSSTRLINLLVQRAGTRRPIPQYRQDKALEVPHLGAAVKENDFLKTFLIDH